MKKQFLVGQFLKPHGLKGGIKLRSFMQSPADILSQTVHDQDGKAYSYLKQDGIDLEALRKVTDRFGTIDKNKAEKLGYKRTEAKEWLKHEVDILIPAALENSITKDNVKEINSSVKIVICGANGPVTPEAEDILSKKGVVVIPDFLANAGGVVCSYFEQVQSNQNYYWTKEEVLGKLDNRMTEAFYKVWELAQRKKIRMSDAAYMIAIQRVAEACKLRGWI